MLRRSLASLICMNASVSARPSVVAKKSAGDGALPSAFCWPGAPSKKNGTGTGRMLEHLLQPARTDAVGALLVFLHLLKGQAEGVAELFLTHAQHHPPHAHARAHMLIDRIGYLLSHNDPLCLHLEA